MFHTWPGQVWMTRNGLLIVTAFFLLAPCDVTRFSDWFAARSTAFLLSATALGLAGSSGHIAALSGSLWPQSLDMLHLLAVGVWFGALPSLAYLLHSVNVGRTVPDPYSLRTIRRFSHVALIAVVVIAGTGFVSAWLLGDNFVGIIGTIHGRLLLAKIAILVPALLLAAKVRQLLCNPKTVHALPPTTTIAQRMAYYIAGEAMLLLILLGLAVAMTLSVPAIHSDPIWPLPIRLSLVRLEQVFLSQLSVQSVILRILALFTLLAAIRVSGRLRLYFLAGWVACLSAAAVVVAYPTSFVRPPVSYDARSIAKGKAIYQQDCTACSTRYIESEASKWLTPGDLFWFVSNGLPEQEGLSDFDHPLAETDRWHVVNFMRAHISASESRTIGSEIDFENPWLVAPDFAISIGPLTPFSLYDYRNRRIVLLVLYNLPESQERLRSLALRYGTLSSMGVEIVAVSRQPIDNPIAKLGDEPAMVFPIVTSGNTEINTTYGLFVQGESHAELLIDRQGYIRAIWRKDEIDTNDVRAVLAQVERLNQEKTPPPLPEAHVH